MGKRFLVAAVGTLAACGQGFHAEQYPDPMVLFAASKDAYRHGNCDDAAKGFERLSFETPARDPLQAELRYYLAECTLRRSEYLEAARQFRRVADEFPQHPLAPDALLRSGDAFTELWRRPELDPTYGENALAVWRELANRYPESTASKRAALRINEVNEMFAAKAYENGSFYLRLGAYDSAILYFKDLLANFPRASTAPDAVLKLIAAYDKIGYTEEKQEMCGYLRQYYPEAAPRAEACASAETP